MEPLDSGSESVPGTEQDATAGPVDPDTAVLLLSAGVTTITHPLLYVKLLIQVASCRSPVANSSPVQRCQSTADGSCFTALEPLLAGI